MELRTSAEVRKDSPASRPWLLLIDDEEHIREAVRLVLETRGYDVTECGDAREALALLESGRRPQLIVFDLMMPHMDGWQFRVELKRNQSFADIPVIALSADGSAQALAMDVDSYLSKPVDQQRLLETVDRLLSARAPERQRATEPQQTGGSLCAFASELVHSMERPIGYTLANLQLAQNKAEELEARLPAADAFSMVGIRQLLTRAQRGAERIAGLSRGSSSLAALADTQPGPARPRLLVVDSNPTQRERVRSRLEHGHEIELASTPAAALVQLEGEQAFDGLLLALVGPAYEAIELYELLRARVPEQARRVIFITEGRLDERARQFMAHARCPQLRRPLNPSELQQLLLASHSALH